MLSPNVVNHGFILFFCMLNISGFFSCNTLNFRIPRMNRNVLPKATRSFSCWIECDRLGD